MIECKNCRYKGCALCGTDHKIHAATCETYTPATHADKLRSMTDEELAEFLAEYRCVHKAPHCMEANCSQCWLDWLRQEA